MLQIASAMVACTFISAPLMFISAKMVSVSNLSPKDFIPSLERFEFDLSIVGVFACVCIGYGYYFMLLNCLKSKRRCSFCFSNLILLMFLEIQFR